MPLEKVVYSVSQVNRYVKAIINNDENLKFIYVKGELSNVKAGANGHLYFSLKDQECLISAAMFNTYAAKLSFTPKNGDEVTVLASVDVYPTRGTYQLIVYDMNQVGQGLILVELEKLKKQLQQEGLFDVSRKRELNIYPKAIGVITAKNSAAIKDIVFNIKRRYPLCDIYFFPSSVQGENAPKELLAAFEKSQEYDLDTLIIGRGGGASEDLSAFNDEKLVRAIATSKMPVIAAVGHEIDSTLVDYVADKRASTPTGAAELATVDMREIQTHIQYSIEDMQNSLKEKVEELKEAIQERKDELSETINDLLDDYKKELAMKKECLIALSPLEILNRGYSITLNKDGNVINDPNEIIINDELKTITAKSVITSKVEKVEAK